MEDSLQMPFLTASGNWGTWAFSFPQLGKGERTQKKKKKEKKKKRKFALVFCLSCFPPNTHNQSDKFLCISSYFVFLPFMIRYYSRYMA